MAAGGDQPRQRLFRQLDLELVKQEGEVGVRLDITRHHQAPAISRRQLYIQCLNRGEILQDRSRRQSRRMRLQSNASMSPSGNTPEKRSECAPPTRCSS